MKLGTNRVSSRPEREAGKKLLSSCVIGSAENTMKRTLHAACPRGIGQNRAANSISARGSSYGALPFSALAEHRSRNCSGSCSGSSPVRFKAGTIPVPRDILAKPGRESCVLLRMGGCMLLRTGSVLLRYRRTRGPPEARGSESLFEGCLLSVGGGDSLISSRPQYHVQHPRAPPLPGRSRQSSWMGEGFPEQAINKEVYR